MRAAVEDAAPAQGLHRRRATRCSKPSWPGADAVLLIVGALDAGGHCGRCCDVARQAGVAALVEVHDAVEMCVGDRRRRGDHRREQPQSAHARGGAGRARAAWRPLMPKGAVAVAESGLRETRGSAAPRARRLRRVSGRRTPDRRARSRRSAPRAEAESPRDTGQDLRHHRRPRTLLLAADLGASAIGMVFWPGSPRVRRSCAARRRSSPRCRRSSDASACSSISRTTPCTWPRRSG